MKELTVEQKAQRYDEALEKAKELIVTSAAYDKFTIEKIFPELKETEDERIRKALIKYHKSTIDIDGIKGGDILSWLEKQAEQKPDDKVEIKFKVGDWVLYSGDYYEGVRHITKIDENGYYINRNGLPHGIIPFNHEICMRLWTIQDAKDGDVLVIVNDERPFIYKGCLDPKHPDSPVAYCGIDDGGYFCGGSNKFNHWWTDKKVQPATKEQRNTLFKAMADAGYTFDFEKKELKKIEQKPVAITDEWIEDYWQHHKVINPYSYDKGEEIQFDHRGFVRFCKKYCGKLAWSEEDEHRVKDTIYFLDTAKKHYASVIELDACIDWLKSLKYHN